MSIYLYCTLNLMVLMIVVYRCSARYHHTLPYIDALLHNIRNRFSGEAVNLLISSSVFNPESLPLEETALPDYGKKEVEVLAQFYGSEATVF